MDKALLTRVEKQALFHRYPRLLPATLFVIGLIITILFVLNIEQSDAAARRLKLEADSAALATGLERETSENAAYLKAAASMFAIADDVSQNEFARLVTEMSEDHQTRGSLGMGWAQWVKPDRVPALDAELARRYASADHPIRVWPKPTDPDAEMAIITYLEPVNPDNLRAVGFDMNSEPKRRAAMEAARRLDRPIATAKVQLLQDFGKSTVSGALIYLPVFARQQGPLGQPRGVLKGFIYTPIRAHDFLATAITESRRDFGRVALYDGTITPENLLASAGSDSDNGAGFARQIDFAGRKWSLVVQDRKLTGLTSTSTFVLGFGIWASLLLMALARMATSRAAEDRKVLEWLQGQSAIRNALTRELNHRVKNTLANVLSIVALTRRRAHDLDEFADDLTGRVRALSATHDLLSQREWRNAPIGEVVRSELAPYLDPADPQAEIDGPEALLNPNDAMSLGLALHELATNAAKYGALSAPDGKVSVSWEIPDPAHCVITWREIGGPAVTAPTRRGFGMDLIEKIVSRELSTAVDLRFEPSGVVCVLAVPLRQAREFVLREGSSA